MSIHDSHDSNIEAAIEVNPRSIPEEQIRKFEGYVGEIFGAFGLNLDTPGTKNTPQRFIKALYDSTEGYDGDPKLLTVFDTECRGGFTSMTATLKQPLR